MRCICVIYDHSHNLLAIPSHVDDLASKQFLPKNNDSRQACGIIVHHLLYTHLLCTHLLCCCRKAVVIMGKQSSMHLPE